MKKVPVQKGPLVANIESYKTKSHSQNVREANAQHAMKKDCQSLKLHTPKQ